MALETQATAVVIGIMVLVAAATDLRWGKIYNWLTLPVLALAPVWHLSSRQLPGLWFSLQGFGVTVVALTLMAMLAGRGMGGGDMKLLATVGALGGPSFALWALLFTALSGPIVVVPAMIRQRIVGYTLRNLAANMAARYAGGRADVAIGDGSRGGKLPFGVCICVGTLIALCYPGLRW